MPLLEELWLDGNRLQTVPTFIGNLTNLRHLDLSVNQLTDLTDQIGCCTKLIDLTLSTNDLQVVITLYSAYFILLNSCWHIYDYIVYSHFLTQTQTGPQSPLLSLFVYRFSPVWSQIFTEPVICYKYNTIENHLMSHYTVFLCTTY